MNDIIQGLKIFAQFDQIKADFSERGMDNPCFFGAVFHLTSFGIGHRLGHIHSHGAQFGIGHQALGSQNFSQTSHQSHHVRRGNANVKIDGAALDNFNQIFCTNDIGAGGFGLFGLGTTGKHGHTGLFSAFSVGQGQHAADVFIGFAGIHAQHQGHFDGFIEFDFAVVLQNLQRFVQTVNLGGVNSL